MPTTNISRTAGTHGKKNKINIFLNFIFKLASILSFCVLKGAHFEDLFR